jgi:predicted site-specific integrase-resolvase
MPKIDVYEVAERIGRSPWSVRMYVRQGRIPHFRPGGERGHLVFDSEEIDRWLESQRREWKPRSDLQKDEKGRFQPIPA